MVRQEEASIKFYQEALTENSQSLVFSRLADCFRKKGEIQDAIGVCTQGLSVHPNYITGRVILGRCYLEQEKIKEAIGEFVRVVELDRRNQVAVKMIADIYARQGMKEKAADLYTYLLRMDPENQSLARLANASAGTGETNILKILGVSSQKTPAAPSSSQDHFDSVEDMDKTIQMDLSTQPFSPVMEQTSNIGEMFVKTQEFKPGELTGTEQLVDSDAPEIKQADAITGDDVSSRMSMLFGNGESEELTVPDISQNEAGPLDKDSGEANEVIESVAEDQGILHEETSAASLVDIQEAAAVPVVSGSDITSRLEQLFGDTTPQAEPADTDMVSDFTQAYDPKAMIKEPEVLSTSTEAVLIDPPKSAPSLIEGQNISGEDVTERLNEMFSDNTSSIEAPLAEIGKLLDMHSTMLDEEQKAVSESDIPAEMPEDLLPRDNHEEEENRGDGMDVLETMPGPIDEQDLQHSAVASVISGDDVASRLESIFEDEENEIDKVNSLEDAGVTESLDISDTPVASDAPDVAFEEQNIMIGGDISDEEMPSDDATMIGTIALPPEENTIVNQEAAAVPSAAAEYGIDDDVAADEQPQMSGDDVVGRLDELFSDKMLEAGAGGIDSIPDGEKEEAEVNQGFYTMSGENAETSKSEEIMLSELDKQDDVEEEKSEISDEEVFEDADETVEKPQADIFLDHDTLDPLQNIVLTPGPDRIDDDDMEPEQIDEQDNSETLLMPEIQKNDENAAATDQYSIPDHVLTPTLADIYFQQGQPVMALQIFQRILQSDPDNETIAEKIKEIQKHISLMDAAQEKIEPAAVTENKMPRKNTVEEPVVPVAMKKENIKKQKKAKPLTGVRIKKMYKNRIKKSK